MNDSNQRPKRMKRAALIHKTPPEIEVHVMIADVLRFAVVPGWLWWHTPNGELRDKITAARLKRMGVKPGVSDFLLLSPDGDFHALELKREGKSPTGDQCDFLQSVANAGCLSAWVDNFDDAVTILRNWGALRIR